MAPVQDLSVRMTIGVTAGKSMSEMGIADTAANRALWAEVEESVQTAAAYGGGIGVEPEWADAGIADIADTLYGEAFWDGLREITGINYSGCSPQIGLVTKSNSERRYTLGPMYIPDRMDAHGEWTDAEELQEAVWKYVEKGDRRIRLQHNRDVVAGQFVEIMAWPYAVEVPMMQKDASTKPVEFPANTVFLGVVWEPWAWEMVKSGKLRGYSIGGRAQRLLVDLPEPMDKSLTEAEPVTTDPSLSTAIAEALKAAPAPVVNVVLPAPRSQRIERDESGKITRIVAEEE